MVLFFQHIPTHQNTSLPSPTTLCFLVQTAAQIPELTNPPRPYLHPPAA